ncbi:hypothetical protein A2U01_0067752 [Trifolium medium]|uniref:Uncharacterized protein n=1 Tax=Trifolium medium TaxID=97028 RepID=A0A392SDJ6_9FABA|nr:hypothetical protein [Trifolium medium]
MWWPWIGGRMSIYQKKKKKESRWRKVKWVAKRFSAAPWPANSGQKAPTTFVHSNKSWFKLGD